MTRGGRGGSHHKASEISPAILETLKHRHHCQSEPAIWTGDINNDLNQRGVAAAIWTGGGNDLQAAVVAKCHRSDGQLAVGVTECW